MGLLEDALRDTFATQVAAPPAMDDAAGRAVARAARLRRRRTTMGTLAAVVGLALVGTGVVAFAGRQPSLGSGDPPAAAASPSMVAVPLGLDVLVGHQIIATTGSAVALDDLPSPQRAWRVTAGWLVETYDAKGRAALWSLTVTAKPTLLAEGERVAVGQTDAGQVLVAWADSGRLSAATLAGAQLRDRRDTSGTGSLGPVAVVGNGVLLSDGGVYDMWFPHQGDYSKGPQSTDEVIGTGRGRIFGLSKGFQCFVQIEPVGLSVSRSRCGAGPTTALAVLPSPDGRWLAAFTEGQVDVYELASVWSSSAPRPVTWKLRTTSGQWLPDGTLAVAATDQVVHLHPGDPDRMESTPLPSMSGTTVMLIPDLR